MHATDLYGGIRIAGVGQRFRNNLVHNTVGQVVTVSGNDHLVEYNELFNVGIEEGDGGAIYCGAEMWSYGNVFRRNFLHHLMCVPQAHPRGGIYCDDRDAGDTIRENLFYKAAQRAVLLNGGTGHTVDSNIFLTGDVGIYNTEILSERDHGNVARYESGELKRGDKGDYIWRTEQAVGKQGWNKEPWKSRYPTFAKVMAQDKMRFWPIECQASNNRFWGNVENTQVLLAGKKKQSFEQYPHIKAEGNASISLRAFKDPKALDFSYRDAATKDSLPDIQFEKIGLYVDEFRTTMPNKRAYRTAIAKAFANRKSFDGAHKYDPQTINELLYFNTGLLVYSQAEQSCDLASLKKSSTSSQQQAAEDEHLGMHPDGGIWGYHLPKETEDGLPNVLLIGDSIMHGYQAYVRSGLAGKANVYRWLTPEHLKSPGVDGKLTKILASRTFDVIHFNLGLHGLDETRVPTKEYQPELTALITLFKQGAPQSKLIWATTTQVHEKGNTGKLDNELNPKVIERNAISRTIMERESVAVNDLYETLAPHLNLVRGDRWHWQVPAYKIMGEAVRRNIEHALR